MFTLKTIVTFIKIISCLLALRKFGNVLFTLYLIFTTYWKCIFYGETGSWSLMRLSVHRTCLGGTRECLNGRKEKRARVCSGNKGRNHERNGGILKTETRGKKGSGARFSKGPITFLACVSQMCPESRPCVHVIRHQRFAQHRLAKSRRIWL